MVQVYVYFLSFKDKILYFRFMKILRFLLFPFTFLYGVITGIRNFFYDKGFFRSYTFSVPVIAVGNLSTGGTGKSPQTEYLIRLLKDNYRVATLSRGYKRKSQGFVLADANANAETLGDEPYQFHNKFPDITVAVDADRKNGIEQLLSLSPKPEVIILDDAYQHRRVKAGFYILLTAYGDIYADDFILPTGNLRESRRGAKRADIIVVTKCPPGISEDERNTITRKLKPEAHQKVYFSYIDYDNKVYSENKALAVADIKAIDKLLIAGIAKPQPFFSFLKANNDDCIAFPDHHDFSADDISNIQAKAQGKIIITTEKDYVRLKGKLPKDKLYYLPIKSTLIDREDEFNKSVLAFVSLFSVSGNQSS
jgi:tetraacyldisaccharide 4'-kinase